MSDVTTGAQQTYPPNPYMQPQQYQYTEDEKRVLQECRSESFWYRCVPFALGGAFLTKYLISRGVLTAKRGPAPKMLFAAMGGYFIGKLSYIKVCNNKILVLQNSPMAEALREGIRARKQGLPPPPYPGAIQAPYQGAPQAAYGAGATPSDSKNFGGVQISGLQSEDTPSNMDIDTSNVKRIDDYQEQLQEGEAPIEPKMTTTYEELRHKNRSTRPLYHSQYAQTPQQQAPPAQGGFQQGHPAPARRPVQQKTRDEEFPLGRSTRKNKYGDDWE